MEEATSAVMVTEQALVRRGKGREGLAEEVPARRPGSWLTFSCGPHLGYTCAGDQSVREPTYADRPVQGDDRGRVRGRRPGLCPASIARAFRGSDIPSASAENLVGEPRPSGRASTRRSSFQRATSAVSPAGDTA